MVKEVREGEGEGGRRGEEKGDKEDFRAFHQFQICHCTTVFDRSRL